MIIVLPDSAAQILAKLLTVDDNASGLNATTLQGNAPSAFDTAGSASSAVTTHVGQSDPHAQYELESANTAAAILAKLLTVDGAGSGLDADLLDGKNTGTSANNIVVLDGSAKLPAVDGSQLTNLPAPSGVLLANGTVAGATSQAQTLTNGIITGKIYPSANSTNAFGLYRANGATQDVFYDSANGRLGIGVIPEAPVHTKSSSAKSLILERTTADPTYIEFRATGGSGYVGALGGLFYFNNVASLTSIFATIDVVNKRLLLNSTGGTGQPTISVTDTTDSGEITINWREIKIIRAAGLLTCTGSLTYSATSHVFTNGKTTFAAATTARASINIPTDVATPTSPATGDTRQDGTHCYMYLAGVWKQLDN